MCKRLYISKFAKRKIENIFIDNETNFYTLNIRLFNDMTNLGYVYIIKAKDREEIIQLEAETKKDE